MSGGVSARRVQRANGPRRDYFPARSGPGNPEFHGHGCDHQPRENDISTNAISGICLSELLSERNDACLGGLVSDRG